jgi:O-antigen ligase
MILVVVNVVSVMLSADFFPSLKQFISFTIEVLVFYFLISTSLEDESELIKSLNIAWFALAVIAFFAVVERYFDFQISSLVPGYVRRLGTETQLKSTLPHRILLGTTMAMAFPIALVMTIYYRGRWFKQLIYWGSVIMFAATCYFSTSRGPWLGLVLAFVILFTIGSNIVRKRIIILIALAVIGLLTRPGVWTTLNARVDVTMDDTSFKGGTYQYRWELWKRAYESITMAPHRFLFGYGPGTSETMNWEGVEGFSQEWQDFWSWDNHYAADLLEIGFVGLFMQFLIYLLILLALFKSIRETDYYYRDLFAGIMTSILVYMFMKTNVKIYALQLDYLFWILTTVGILLYHSYYYLVYNITNQEKVPEDQLDY